MNEACRLCGATATLFFSERRKFLRCSGCRLLLVPRAELPSLEIEKERYLMHHNDEENEGYRAFLGRAVDRLRPRLMPGARGLDYGCGPGPVLAKLFTEAGFPTLAYDPLFAPHEDLLKVTYDFVTCTETAEHFHEPGREFEKLASLLHQESSLLVMTRLYPEGMDFSKWGYARDPTHVSLYSNDTMQWISRRFGWKCDVDSRDIAIFRR